MRQASLRHIVSRYIPQGSALKMRDVQRRILIAGGLLIVTKRPRLQMSRRGLRKAWAEHWQGEWLWPRRQFTHSFYTHIFKGFFILPQIPLFLATIAFFRGLTGGDPFVSWPLGKDNLLHGQYSFSNLQAPFGVQTWVLPLCDLIILLAFIATKNAQRTPHEPLALN